MSKLHIATDRDKCQGYGKCAKWAPDTFSLDESNRVVAGDPDASPEEMVIRAAKSCPYRVITVSSDEKGQIFPPVKKTSAAG